MVGRNFCRGFRFDFVEFSDILMSLLVLVFVLWVAFLESLRCCHVYFTRMGGSGLVVMVPLVDMVLNYRRQLVY